MKHLIYPVLLGLGLAACSQSRDEALVAPAPETASPAPTSQATNEPVEMAKATNAPPQPGSFVQAPHPPAASSRPDRAIVYQGQLELAVTDFEKASDDIDRLVQQHGAYLGTAHETRANGQHRQEMTLKVPPTKFLSLVTALGKLGTIENKDISSTDVTADVLEAATSLSAKQAQAAQNQRLLAQVTAPAEKGRLTEQARQLQEEISLNQAQLQQLGARSSWATLTLRYFQELPAPAPDAPMPDFAPRFLTAFYRGWSVVLGLLVALTNIWPLLLLGGAGSWAYRRSRLRHEAAA